MLRPRNLCGSTPELLIVSDKNTINITSIVFAEQSWDTGDSNRHVSSTPRPVKRRSTCLVHSGGAFSARRGSVCPQGGRVSAISVDSVVSAFSIARLICIAETRISFRSTFEDKWEGGMPEGASTSTVSYSKDSREQCRLSSLRDRHVPSNKKLIEL